MHLVAMEKSFVFLRPRWSLIINPFIVYSIRGDDRRVTKSSSLMLRYYRRTITYINHPGTVRVTISEYNGALATTTCTQRDNTRTYTIHYTHVCPRRTPVALTHSHVYVRICIQLYTQNKHVEVLVCIAWDSHDDGNETFAGGLFGAQCNSACYW